MSFDHTTSKKRLGSKTFPPWHDEESISLLKTVHENRRIHLCVLCLGLGVEGTGMFLIEERRAKSRTSQPGRRISASLAHVRCWIKDKGISGFLALAPTQQDALTLSDMKALGWGRSEIDSFLSRHRRCQQPCRPRSGHVLGSACLRPAQAGKDFCTFHENRRAS